MPSASTASAGIVPFATAEFATSACRVIAPITSASPSLRMPANSEMPRKSTSVPGCASRSFIAATRLCPPARGLPPVLARAFAASASVFGSWYSKVYMNFSLTPGALNRLPHAMRRCRHVEMRDPDARQCVHHRIHQRGRSANCSRFATPFCAQGIVRARRHFRPHFERWDVVGARQPVIHQAAGQQLSAFVVVDAMLEHRLTDSLTESAVHLSLD